MSSNLKFCLGILVVGLLHGLIKEGILLIRSVDGELGVGDMHLSALRLGIHGEG